MEFQEKLQMLRRQRGLTQEELAASLYVSRTAISKWESGRGYPSIDSLRAIADFFAVTVDELLSGSQMLSLAASEQKQTSRRFFDLIFGLLDISAILLLFLPFFVQRTGDGFFAVTLLSLGGIQTYLKVLYILAVSLTAAFGVLTLSLQACKAWAWVKYKSALSLALSGFSVLLFIVSAQPHPNAAIFVFALTAIKAILLITRR